MAGELTVKLATALLAVFFWAYVIRGAHTRKHNNDLNEFIEEYLLICIVNKKSLPQ